MATKKSNKKTTKFEFKGYANINVPEAHHNQIEKHIANSQGVYEEINTLAVDGYSIKIYYDSEQENFRASITCMNAEDGNFGYVLGAYAGDWYTALAVLTYKHFDVAKENWLEFTAEKTKGWG